MNYFIAGSTNRISGDLMGIHLNAAIRFVHKLRVKIALTQQHHSEKFCGNTELDESFFSGVPKNKRGRRAAEKAPVFGLLKRAGEGYTQVITALNPTPLCLSFAIKQSLTALLIQIFNGVKRHETCLSLSTLE